ncbi:Heat shock protein Hsp70 [Venturia nashicola]|uniref:Heat shock protein Hsp70 n=1 Tax=Venturia nashicola TaxID=86259 RepID=A0A4Z1PIK1_9PEZI|nr:Heat shock protein Hsp70 [Venturia nashicola]
MVVYYIDAISPLRIRELVPGLGGNFGSTAINRALLGWLSTTFGDSFNNIDDAKTRPRSVLMNQFEEQKSIFGTESCRPGKKESEYLVRLAMKDVVYGLPYDHVECNVVISKAVMESLFSHPV